MGERVASCSEQDNFFWDDVLHCSTDGDLYDGSHEQRAIAADTHRLVEATYDFPELERIADGFRGDVNNRQ